MTTNVAARVTGKPPLGDTTGVASSRRDSVGGPCADGVDTAEGKA